MTVGDWLEVMSHSRRLAQPLPHQLSPDQLRVYNAITQGPRAARAQHFEMLDADGRLMGPFGAMLLQPAVGFPLQKLGAAIRYRTRLSDREREIAILAVAGYWESSFEIAAHSRVARAVGLSEEVVQALVNNRAVPLDDPTEVTVLDVCRKLVVGEGLDDEVFDTVSGVLGLDRLYELTLVVGYYALLALQLRVFGAGIAEVDMPQES